MTFGELRARWLDGGDEILDFTPELVGRASIPTSAKHFLLECGVPRDAAPFLSFGNRGVASLDQIGDVWPVPEALRDCWCIGVNGSGDPICIRSDGQVVSLNHDNGFAVELINSSVNALFETILAYRQVVERTRTIGGKGAFLDNRIPQDVQGWFYVELSRIDPVATTGPSMWRSELDGWQRGPTGDAA